MKLYLALVCIGALFTQSGCASSRTWDGPVVEPLVDGGGVVESGMYRGMPYIMASIDGSEPMKFLFDTGASMNLIMPEFAQRLGLDRQGKAHVTGASGLTKKIPFTLVDRVEFGPVAMEDILFLIQDNNHLAEYFDEHIAGLIGIRGLDGFTIDIDYPNRKVAITNERLDIDDPDTSPYYTSEDGLCWAPMSFVDADHPGFTRTIWAMLDTGNAGILDLEAQDAKPLVEYAQSGHEYHSMGIHGVEQVNQRARTRSGMMMGSTMIEGIPASINTIENRFSSDEFRNFRVRLDGLSKLVSFTRSDHATRLVSTERMGITNLWTLDGYRIENTIEGSPAYLLGIRAFDEVLLIDGVEPGLLHVKTAFWAVDPGATTITLRIRRMSDDGWVDVVLPIDGSVEGIEEQERINDKMGIEYQMTDKDGKVVRGVLRPLETKKAK